MKRFVRKQPEVDTYTYCNGAEKMAVHGMKVRAVTQQQRATCTYCNGAEKMAVHGMKVHAVTQQ